MAKRIFKSPYDQYCGRNNEVCEVFRVIREQDSEHDIEEVGTMYEIRFPDGEEIEAWPEELHKL